MYDTCIFDLYGTLVDIHTEEEKNELWEKMGMFYGYYGAYYQPEELKITFRQLIAQLEAGQRGLREDAHEAHPEIPIEQVFLKLFEEKQITADLTLAVHAGQFFRVMSTEYIRLYDGTEEMLKALKQSGKNCIFFPMHRGFLRNTKREHCISFTILMVSLYRQSTDIKSRIFGSLKSFWILTGFPGVRQLW